VLAVVVLAVVLAVVVLAVVPVGLHRSTRAHRFSHSHNIDRYSYTYAIFVPAAT
jgi:hypothetical protein